MNMDKEGMKSETEKPEKDRRERAQYNMNTMVGTR